MSDFDATKNTRKQLSALVEFLDARRGCILECWRRVTESEPEMTTSASLTRSQFNDHIPGVLDAFARTLKAWPSDPSAESQQDEKDKVTEHGLQRWQQGYKLRELTREWGHLQMCLLEELEEYAAAHPETECEAMRVARRVLARMCWDGISDSTAQFWRLHQAEAAGRVRELQQAVAALNEVDRVRAEAWREAAHDLRGSVGVVTTATSLLDRADVPEAMRDEFFDILRSGVTSLHEMLGDLMSLARLEAGQEQLQIAPFDAAAMLTDFCTTSMPLADARGLYLKTEGPASLPVEGDRSKIRRILQNLLLNALKYTEQGGVTVIWGDKEMEDSNRWMFCVQDTGPGLDAGPGAPLARQILDATKVSHEVNDSSEQLANGDHVENAPTVPAQSETLPTGQVPGEGVGLSIVKRLCDLLDASLEYETSPGEGSTFRVTLPCSYEPRT